VPQLKWNVYIAQVGFIEGGITKFRPVIALNEPVGRHRVVLVAPIYTHKQAHNVIGDIAVSEDYAAVGLLKPSTIRLHRIVSVLASDLKEQLGSATPQLQRAIAEGMRQLLSI
jgi:hypothetical protein